MKTFEEYLKETAIDKKDIDRFLSPDEPTWAQFDPELGYALGKYMPRDGIDGSSTISTSEPDGSRTSVVYANRPCRIHTYGNSMTLCHQVSNHETWQEYLAAHLGEPIKNFGMGGYGAYQAYRRMIRTEAKDAAKFIIYYIYGDDCQRSVLRCRLALTRSWWKRKETDRGMLHNNFWANLEMDLETGKFVEKKNLLSTPESLYKMTSPDFMVEALRDDLMLQMGLFGMDQISDLDEKRLNRLAEILACPSVGKGDRDQKKEQVNNLKNAYAFAATRHILDLTEEFINRHGKKLLVLLLDHRVIQSCITDGTRFDQPVVDYLKKKNIRYFDMNLYHVEDYKCFKLSLNDYMKRYFIPHYSPSGNHFFAFAIKKTVVDWLDPKPITYRVDDQVLVGFKGYLAE